jgi:uncharacterized protein (DUF1697 family)
MKYIAFFRGINVGGRNVVKMAELKQLFVELCFHEVKTYIQSGNVVFSSDKEKASLITLIEKGFEEQFGFKSTVIVRSNTEISNIISSLPFTTVEIKQAEKEMPDVEHLYVYLSDTAVDREKVRHLCESFNGKDKVYVNGYEMYLLCFQSIKDSKLATLLTKLPHTLTTRNFKTIKKVYSMFYERADQ